VRVIDRKGTFKDIPNVWLDEGSLAIILSLSLLEEQFRIQFDNALFDGFKLHRGNGETWPFKKFATGLYYYDTSTVDNKSTLTE
jgi:hypothetical protein